MNPDAIEAAAPLRLLPSPDCRDGKHRSCTGDGWDERTDAPAPCPCKHHVRN